MTFNITPVLAFLWAVVEPMLVKAANELWDGLWEEIFKAVMTAEEKWTEQGVGAAKKAEALALVVAYIDATKLNFLQKMVVKLFASKAIDAVVAGVNEQLGHNWVERVKALETALAEKLPVIE
jgi:hypothetical protein